MRNVYVDSKKDKKEEKNEETEEIKKTTIKETEEVEKTTVEDTEASEEEVTDEKVTDEEDTESDEKFDYKVYGKETVEETKNIAEKMFNDVVSTLKSTQNEWNKTLEEYKSNKPPVDLLEYDDCLVVKLDVPRVSKEDISLKMTTEALEIDIEFPDTIDEEEEVKVLRCERCTGKTKNVVTLPVEVDINEVNASFENNVLTVTLPKIRGKKVDVEIL